MKCTRIQRIVLECDETELTDEIILHLETCAECADCFRKACSCRRMIALKRYEIPSELRREVCLGEVHNRLVYLQSQRDRTGYVMHPGLRYGIAAAVVAMVAAHVVAMHGFQPLPSPVTGSEYRSPTIEQFFREPSSMLSGSAIGSQLFDTYPTTPTNFPPVRSESRPPSIFFVEE